MTTSNYTVSVDGDYIWVQFQSGFQLGDQSYRFHSRDTVASTETGPNGEHVLVVTEDRYRVRIVKHGLQSAQKAADAAAYINAIQRPGSF